MSKLLAILSVATIAVGVLPQGATRPPDHLIDLTLGPTAAPRGAVTPKGRAGRLRVRPAPPDPTDVPPRPPPILVALDPDSSTTFVLGNPFEYSVHVLNSGAGSIVFPQLEDESGIDDQMRGAVAASVSLTFSDRVLGRQTIGAVVLYGAEEVPGSVVIIKPQQTLQIRVPAVWQISSPSSFDSTTHWSRDLILTARVDISPVGRQGLSGSSSNQWRVELQR